MDALSSVIKILEAASNGKFVATFDYSLAFDFTNPAMAVDILRWLGMPAGTAGLLKSVWLSPETHTPVRWRVPQSGGTRHVVFTARRPMVDDCHDSSADDPLV